MRASAGKGGRGLRDDHGPENYSRADGRRIGLNVIVLPALTDDGLRDAQFDLEGGPGLAGTGAAGFYLGPGAAYRRQRDLVFVDMRGTGESNPLRCPGLEAHGDSWAPMYPAELVAACARDLSATADLSQYTTLNAARDIESVRAALGYEKVSFFALSYGTSLALTYIQQHPDRVRAAVLVGTAGPEALPPSSHAPNAQAALDKLFAACRKDAACHGRFPDPAADMSAALKHFGSEPDRAGVFAEWVRTRMYEASTARGIPLALSRAAGGDFSELGKPAGPQPVTADGLYLSITCAESFPHFDYGQAAARARETPFGDYRLRRQQAACSSWPVPPAAPLRLEGQFATPILFVSGELDPVTPPQWADRVRLHFPDSRHVVLPGSGHIFTGLTGVDDCLDPLLVAFIDGADPASVDVACTAAMQPPSFRLQ